MFVYEKEGKKSRAWSGQKSSGWRAVAVVANEACCYQSRALAGKRFLVSEAPRLPMQGCGQADCHCIYKHFDDRRLQPRRADERGGFPRRVESDQRTTPSRRSTPA
jgi:hypothetical protein